MNKRPCSLTLVGWFLVVLSPFTLFTVRSDAALMEISKHSALPVIVQATLAIVGAIVGALCGYGILKGFNWARLVYVGWTLLALIVALITFRPTYLVVLSALVFSLFVMILFRRPAGIWFSGGAEPPLAATSRASSGEIMKIEIKSIRDADTYKKIDLRTYAPPEEKFSLSLIASIGPADERGADDFYFSICSLKWLEEEVRREAVVSGQYAVIVDHYNYRAIEAFLKERLEEAASSMRRVNGKEAAWEHVATQFSEWAYWEFFDHFVIQKGGRRLRHQMNNLEFDD